jgi:hypothetical protein
VPAIVAFAGSRALPAHWQPVIDQIVRSTLASGRLVAVGCAPGADAMVAAAAPDALLYRADDYRVRGLPSAAALAARSTAVVRAALASGRGAGFVMFVYRPCPAGLVPAAEPSRCFRGLGSGSWASAALAAGLGLPVIVFTSSELPPTWGRWAPAAAVGPWARGWRLGPAALPLF